MHRRVTLAPDQYVFSIICDHNLDICMYVYRKTYKEQQLWLHIYVYYEYV